MGSRRERRKRYRLRRRERERARRARCSSGKIAFPDEVSARLRAEKVGRRKHVAGAYKCDECHAWHMTSQWK